MNTAAEALVLALEESVDIWYTNGEYEEFSHRQRAIWERIEAAGLEDEVNAILRSQHAVASRRIDRETP